MNHLLDMTVRYKSCKEVITFSRLRRSAIWTNVSYIPWNESYEFLDYDEEPVKACNSLYFFLEFSNQYYIPFIILLGLVGNLLSCMVFLNTHLKMRSSSYYLAALATADFMYLVTLLLVWLDSTVEWRLFNKEGWCESAVYISSVCSSLSVWLIVAFTVERFIAVQYPLHRPHMCTIARAKAIVVFLVILALLSHSYTLITAGVVKMQDGSEVCEMKTEYLKTMRIISIIDSIASLILPLVMIIVMNTMITRNLLRFSRRFKRDPVASCNQYPTTEINLNHIPTASGSHEEANGIPLNTGINGRRQLSQQSFHSSKSSHSRHQPSIVVVPSMPRSPYHVPEIGSRSIHVNSSSRNPVSTRNQQSITKMLLLISTVFILLNLPSYIVDIFLRVSYESSDPNEKLTTGVVPRQYYARLAHNNAIQY